MPELPEVEAWVRELDPLVGLAPVESARAEHVATLKSFDPPPSALAGRRLAGARRRGKNLLFPTDDDELILRVHLMSAGRLRYVADPAGRARRHRCSGRASRTAASSSSPRRASDDAPVSGSSPPRRSTRSSRTWVRTPSGSGRERLPAILRADRRQLHPLLRDQRALAGIGRAHANEILWRAQLSPFRLSTDLDDTEVAGLAAAIAEDLERALALRIAGKGDAAVYEVHGRFGQPCPRCADELRRVDFEEHTITYCPSCQTGGRVLKDRRLSRLLR